MSREGALFRRRARVKIAPVEAPILSRRLALAAAIAALGTRPAASQGNAALAAALAQAAEDGDLMWYESSPRDQLERVAWDFARSFPATRIRVRAETIAGVAILGRLQQEYRAGGGMADLASLGSGGLARLVEGAMLREVDWARLGLDPMLVVGRHAVMTGAAVYCIICNTRLVRENETPRRWEDLLNPRWRGRIGTWVRAAAFAELASVWGAERTTQFYMRFLDQRPLLFRSTAPLAQLVASGEIAVGLGIRHTALAAQARGAPIRLHVPDPTPVSAIYTGLLADTRKPNAATLLAAWLATPEGALAYERATDRGNPLVAGTAAQRLLAGHQLAEWPMDRKADYARLLDLYNGMVNEAEAR
jgi:ABC-type Fe3+ transport system substrate-binding protein